MTGYSCRGKGPNQLMLSSLPIAARDSLGYKKDFFSFLFLLLAFPLQSCVSQQLQVVSTLFIQALGESMYWVFCIKARSAFLHMTISLCFYAPIFHWSCCLLKIILQHKVSHPFLKVSGRCVKNHPPGDAAHSLITGLLISSQMRY